MALNWLYGLMIGALLLAACSEAPAQNSDDAETPSQNSDDAGATGIIAFHSDRDRNSDRVGNVEIYLVRLTGPA